MVFAQLTWRESLRDVEACLNAKPETLYHLGFREAVARSTLADANKQRDWRLWRFRYSRQRQSSLHATSFAAGGITPQESEATTLKSSRLRSRDKRTPTLLRKVRYFDSVTRKDLVFLTNHLHLPAFSGRARRRQLEAIRQPEPNAMQQFVMGRGMERTR